MQTNLQRRSPSVNWAVEIAGDPSDRDGGYWVQSGDGRRDSWHRWQADAGRRAEQLNDEALGLHAPAGEGPDEADRDWWAHVHRSEWWADLAEETVSDAYGEPTFEYNPLDSLGRELYEAEVERHQCRSRAMRIDAEEEARLLGWLR